MKQKKPLKVGKKRNKMVQKKRYFVLRKNGKDTNHVFTSKTLPRQAALKAANKGFKDIVLRERGANKLHIYKGSREQVNAPENKPDWMPSKIWRSNVKKVEIKHI